jgi:hypothetical protein
MKHRGDFEFAFDFADCILSPETKYGEAMNDTSTSARAAMIYQVLAGATVVIRP